MSNLVTVKQIKRELEKIYKERKKWSGAKEPFDKLLVLRREFLFIKQQILENQIKYIIKNL